ncbi:leucine-rich repeat extensin-like protein 2 [Syzygium oleosum]|uniref:leucine-rich repeat extensin-like protein 2 n=1 Tax=Syzygium oleosum TaxID=219896 RepID=UPI0024B9F70A|nr:leucine-rich repeat extensin-like protein 2 [Syzygium oleosum]
MIPELEKPRVTEINVRMDCNGCVQKIKKALHGINGIYDLHIDFPQQKLTIVGWADPEKIVKAIRKTRKTATICSHTEPSSDQPSQPTEQAPNSGAPPPTEAANPSQPEAPPSEQPKEPPPQENPPPPPPQQAENPQPDANPPPAAAANPQEGQLPPQENQPPQPSMPKEVGEVHTIYHHPPEYGYRSYGCNRSYNGHYYNYPSSSSHQAFQHEPPPLPPAPVYVTHSYNTYRPSPYVTEYEYVRSPPPPQYNYSQYRNIDHYGEESPSSYASAAGSGNITSIFSDENPNACRVM